MKCPSKPSSTQSDHTFQQGKEQFLEIFKIQVDDIILSWVADGVPMYWWVSMS